MAVVRGEKKGVKVQFTVFVFVCSVSFFLTTSDSAFHNGVSLFGPLHCGKKGVGFDIVHTSHTCPQSLCRVVLEQLHRSTRQKLKRKKNINETNNLNDTNKPELKTVHLTVSNYH